MILVAFLQTDAAAVTLDDLKIAVVHPDFALEIALTFFNLLGPDVEDETVDLVDHLLAGVFDVVLVNVIASQNEWLDRLNVLKILRGQRDR
jgi:hypothetical protein